MASRVTLSELPPEARRAVLAKALTQTRTPRGMNKLETAFSRILDEGVRDGTFDRWDYEPESLRLAANTFFTPDFRVVFRDGSVTFYEVKGFWRDDARVKIKVAARLHPYRFVAVRREKGEWVYEEF
jgi:hypothetical protein